MSEQSEAIENVAGAGLARRGRAYRSTDPDDGKVSLAVVEALADAWGVSLLDIDPPLYDVVDLEALDALFDTPGNVTDGHVVFTVDDSEVTVTANADVYVRPLE